MLGRHLAVYGLARGGTGLLNFCAIALYTRLLAPEEYGRYALLMASAGVIGSIVFQWLRSGARRFFLAYSQDPSAFLASVGRAYLLTTGGLVAVAAVAAILVHDPALRGLILLGSALLVVQGWFDVNLELLLSGLEPVRYGLFAFSRALIGLACGAVLAVLGYGALGVATGTVLGYAVPAAAMTLGRWRGIRLSAASPEVHDVLVTYGVPLTATYALDFVVGYSDRLLVGALAGVAEAGRYAVAYDLPQQTITTLLMIVSLAAFPLTVRAVEATGVAGAAEHIRRHGALVALIGLPAAVGMAILAPNISHVFLGPQFRAVAQGLIPLIAVAALLAGFKAYFFDLSFQLDRSTNVQVWVSGVAALVNVGLNLWWIPVFGSLGAAYATLVALAAACALSWILGRRRLRLPLPVQAWSRVAVASGIMAALLFPIAAFRGPMALTLQVTWGAFCYGLAVWGLNILGLRKRAAATLTRLLNSVGGDA